MFRRPPLTGIEKSALFLAALFVVIGLWLAIWPRAMVVVHFIIVGDTLPGTWLEPVSETGARVYGVLGLLFGAGIAALALYRRRW